MKAIPWILAGTLGFTTLIAFQKMTGEKRRADAWMKEALDRRKKMLGG